MYRKVISLFTYLKTLLLTKVKNLKVIKTFYILCQSFEKFTNNLNKFSWVMVISFADLILPG